jgi:transcriptional regulator with XRE-family HTH domain
MLRAERERLGWPQRRMARHLGLDPAEYHRLETGQRGPTRVQANRIWSLLGISQTAFDDPADLLPQDGSATGEAA